jgi:hypothetical protein
LPLSALFQHHRWLDFDDVDEGDGFGGIGPFDWLDICPAVDGPSKCAKVVLGRGHSPGVEDEAFPWLNGDWKKELGKGRGTNLHGLEWQKAGTLE